MPAVGAADGDRGKNRSSGQAIRINYAPEDTRRTPPPAGGFVYVIEGAVRMGFENQLQETLHAGQCLYEAPGTLHSIPENANDTEPTSLLAVFVLNEGQEATVRP